MYIKLYIYIEPIYIYIYACASNVWVSPLRFFENIIKSCHLHHYRCICTYYQHKTYHNICYDIVSFIRQRMNGTSATRVKEYYISNYCVRIDRQKLYAC